MASNRDLGAAADAAKVLPSSSSGLLSDPPAVEEHAIVAVHAADTSGQPAASLDGHHAGLDRQDVALQGANIGAKSSLPNGSASEQEPVLGAANDGSVDSGSAKESTINATPVIGDPKRTASLGGTIKVEANGTPAANARGSTRGRPRGRGRGSIRGRGGKRKREDRDEGDSESSEEVYTPAAKITKSGRSIQKPTAYVPPPEPSPVSGVKRKRTYRRNPESAVCKICLRGTSPASNMIVFCDGCNTPYHRYCHHPPIDQSVVDDVDKEWYCKQCESERLVPVPEAEVASFVAAESASAEQRQRYFASLPPGMLVTLLTRATSLYPSLPVFAPEFQARVSVPTAAKRLEVNGNSTPSAGTVPAPASSAPRATADELKTTSGTATNRLGGNNSINSNTVTGDEPVPIEHPSNYPRPGFGLMQTLPPEQEDLQWLVDDDDRSGAFTHLYR
ncbi:hypothetical protein LTR62_004172 [Meristemomyces frigidus]|uniref:PHD-type domain-containing protein n=1 Tax=Meristemomyces frigidus TaxID=1508187 RepID=A0AAN7TRI5_9PEZI|nr:hypothetical protein LTR62_004172 [Meristemomyces frigidus]